MDTDGRPPPRPLVIGVGNRDRGDDGIGPLVADAVRGRCGSRVLVHVAEGDLSDLPMRWEPDQAVIVVDATVSGRSPGDVTMVDALVDGLPVENGLLSSHGIGLAEAVELGRVLGRLPRSLVIFGVEAKRFEHFEPVADEVARAVPALVERISALVDEAIRGRPVPSGATTYDSYIDPPWVRVNTSAVSSGLQAQDVTSQRACGSPLRMRVVPSAASNRASSATPMA